MEVIIVVVILFFVSVFKGDSSNNIRQVKAVDKVANRKPKEDMTLNGVVDSSKLEKTAINKSESKPETDLESEKSHIKSGLVSPKKYPESVYRVSRKISSGTADFDKVDKDSEWGKLRESVFKRDNYRCVDCGGEYNLTVNHIKELSLGGVNDLDNLETLCKDCHEKHHGRRIFDDDYKAKRDYGKKHRFWQAKPILKEAIENESAIELLYRKKDSAKAEIKVVTPKKFYLEGDKKIPGIRAYCHRDKKVKCYLIPRIEAIDGKKVK